MNQGRKIITLLFLFTIFPLQAQLPYLQKKGAVTLMISDGKPFLMIGGEFHNSTSSSTAHMENIDIWSTIKKGNYNTIIASASWELVEPAEGKFNFEQIDYLILKARENDLKIVLIWFASWKNGISSYAPGWVKRDQKKFPLAELPDGTKLNVLSPVGNDNAMKADAAAFSALMRHIKDTDTSHTVIMMQVENEVGVISSPRDFSPVARKAWESDVPKKLIDYLIAHKGNLFPELEKVWSANGYKTRGSWEEVFGKSHTNTDNWQEYPYYTEEIFMAWHYALYIGFIAAEGKKELNIPMYCNAWLKSPDSKYPGKFPSGGPLPEVADIWKAAGPAIDFLAPDIYIDEYDRVLKQYSLNGNPIFIPECTFDIAKELYAIGEYDALGFSPFGLDLKSRMINFHNPDSAAVRNLYKGNSILRGMDQLILNNYGSDKMRGLFVDEETSQQSVALGDYVIKASLMRNQQQQPEDKPGTGSVSRKTGGALIIRTADEEFYIIGKDVMISFDLKDKNSGLHAVTESVDEGTFSEGKWVPGRRLNGDEGYVVRFGEVNVQRVVLFKSQYDSRILY
ncbi:MAG TPA: DUF5597 domain-containing protein [Bacteroidales bacterium]|nr:DUF5597 domain-containing protein [Bacteroidales bacterium]